MIAIAYRESDLSKTQRTRLAVIQEIVATEEAYVTALQLVLNVQEHSNKRSISENIFISILGIYSSASEGGWSLPKCV